MAQVIDSDVVFNGKHGHNTYHTNIADMEGLICQALAQIAGTVSSTNTVNVAAIQAFVANKVLGGLGLQPSGDTTGATDTANIQGLINLGAGNIKIGYGKFYLNAPLVIQASGVQLHGSGGGTASGDDASAGLGTTLVITAGFTNSNSWSGLVTGAIVAIQKNAGAGTGIPNPSSNQVNGVRITDLWIDGRSSPGSVDGIACYGSVNAFQVERVGCYKITGRSFSQYVDPSWSSSAFPDGQHFYSALAQNGGSHGFYGSYVDCCLIDCHAQNCTGDGFYLNGGANNRLISCRSDLNANGYTMDNARSVGSNAYFDGILMVGCGTQGNNQNGLNVINTSANGTNGRSPILLSGCTFEGDGQNSGAGGGGYAAIHAEGKNDIWGAGVAILEATVWATSGSPEYAISTAAVGTTPGVPSTILIDSGFINVVTALVNDTAPAKLISIGPTVQSYVGPQYNGPGVAPLVKPYLAQMNGLNLDLEGAGGVAAGDMLHVVNTTSAPGNAPVLLEGVNASDRLFAAKVTGDNNVRLAMLPGGTFSWGPGGSGNRDVALARTTTGTLNVTDNGNGNSAQVRVTASASQAGSNSLFQAICNASGDVAHGLQLGGDTNNRLRIDSNGQMRWGAGNAVQDVTLQRTIAGRLDLTTGNLFIGNTSAPATPTGGGILYVTGGALHYLGSSGTDTTIAPA